jgi:hypothetical protein
MRATPATLLAVRCVAVPTASQRAARPRAGVRDEADDAKAWPAYTNYLFRIGTSLLVTYFMHSCHVPHNRFQCYLFHRAYSYYSYYHHNLASRYDFMTYTRFSQP